MVDRACELLEGYSAQDDFPSEPSYVAEVDDDPMERLTPGVWVEHEHFGRGVVLRYTVFHEGSDEAVRILEAARMQDKFEPVLDALLEQQPGWAVHGSPEMDVAWEIAGAAGLDPEKAETDQFFPGITGILNQDAA